MRTCKKCGCEFETHRCEACHRASSAAYRAKNLEKVRAQQAQYRQAEEVKARARERAAAYVKANPERVRLAKAEYARANSASIVQRVSEWRKRNPDAKRVQSHNYREKKRSSGRLTRGLALKLFALQRGKCACCGAPLGDDYHMDHIVPLARGGANVDSNIQLLRRACNISKSARDPVEFMQQRGFLL